MSQELERLQIALNVAVSQRNEAQNALVEQVSSFSVRQSELEARIKELESELDKLKNGSDNGREEETPRDSTE